MVQSENALKSLSVGTGGRRAQDYHKYQKMLQIVNS